MTYGRGQRDGNRQPSTFFNDHLMSQRRSNPDFLNGVPELLILKLLSRRSMHGYQLVQSIRASGEVFQFGEGCIYPILHRLEAGGFVVSRRESVGGRSRVVYQLAEPGEKRLDESAQTWAKIAQAVQRVLQGGEDCEPAMA
jgi:PadR family transcriptional regulator, regulatory protein PadR